MNAIQNPQFSDEGNASDTDCFDYAGCATKFRGDLFSGIQIELEVSVPGGSLKASGLGDGLLRGEGIWPLLFWNEGLWPSKRGQDARDTQGRDALATESHPQSLRL